MVSAGLVAALHAAVALVLLIPVRTGDVAVEEALTTFDVVQPSPPPVARHSEAPAPAGREAKRAAPSPVMPPPVAAVIAAPVAADRGDASGGATAFGSGSGAGGAGDGTGSGGSRARLLAGAIRNRDYPKAERAAKVQGVVAVRFTVGADGRASGCAVMRSSGSAALDTVTCRLIAERFRYAPARDAAGTARAEERGWEQRWWIEPGR